MSLANVAIAFDQLLNTLLGGEADESLSARAYRLRKDGWGWVRNTLDLLFFWQHGHCYASYMSEKNRTQLPKEYA